jgi:hypothetical protein
MQGKILDFSVQTNSGIISGDDQQRYSFVGSEWKEQQLPKRGMSVDFDVNTDGHATAIYAALASPNTSTIIQQFQEKGKPIQPIRLVPEVYEELCQLQWSGTS